jgi:hypothetical protein
MIIPSKFNGYVEGVRRCYMGGGGGNTLGSLAGNAVNSTQGSNNPGFSITQNDGTPGFGADTTNTMNVANATMAAPVPPWGTTANSKADYYTNQLNAGKTDAQIRADVEGNTQFGGPQSNEDWKYLQDLSQKNQIGNTQASKADYYNRMLGRGSNDTQIRDTVAGNQLLGQQSDVDWNSLIQTAAMNNSTRRPLAGSGQFYQPVYQSQYDNYNTGNPMGISQYGQGVPAAQNPYMFGGQMMGGGYGQFGMNNPYSPYSNSFLNMPSNLNQGSMQDKANFYGGAIGQGFNDQQLYNQASGLFGQQSPRDWGYLQGTAMGMTPGLGKGSMQDKVGFYNQAQGQGFSDNSIRNAANTMIGQQTPQDWSYLQNAALQARNPYTAMQNAGPAMPAPTPPTIFSRSSMRQPGPIRNYAEGGITALLDKE